MLATKRWSISLMLVVSLVALLPLSMLQAQPPTSNVVLSVLVPEYLGSQLPSDVFAQFEADHAGVKVKLINSGQNSEYPLAAYAPDKYFDNVQKFVSSADVLYVDEYMLSYMLSVEATRAGYFLDLAPLARADSALNADDFVPAAWQALQWDGGMWGMPLAMNVMILSFDPQALDKAVVPYPSGKWTIDDLAAAARKLTLKDKEGKVVQSGIFLYNRGLLYASASGENFYDSSISPNPPQFDKPGLTHVLDVWGQLENDLGGHVDDYNTLPMRLDQGASLAKNLGMSDTPRRGSLFPGGKAGLSVAGLSVSSGTAYPELAYALVKYLSGSGKITSRLFGRTPARRSLQNLPDSADQQTFRPQFTAEDQALIDAAFANAIPPSELRYSTYLDLALIEMREKKLDAKAALQAAQIQAIAVMQTAEAQHKTLSLAVATPVPAPALKAGEVSIKFYLGTYISLLPNRDLWQKAIQEFTSTDPQIRAIDFTTEPGGTDKLTDQFDCFALPYNTVDFSAQGKLLNLEPLMAADPRFDKNDMLGNALSQLQHGDKTLGILLYIQPEVLRYNTDSFAKAGIKPPDNGWTIDGFGDALKALKVHPDDPAPFISSQYGNTYLLMLIAAYGGLPMDFRTTPPTLNFTAPATMDAIRQALDLARNGYIKYKKLFVFGGGGGGGPRTDPIYTDSLSLMNYFQDSSQVGQKNPYRTTSYPKGTQFTPLAYSVGAAYISAKTANPEGCYRWISTLSQHPELFWAMPARRSLLDSQGVSAQGADLTAFYKAYATMLHDPSAVSIPPQYTSAADYIIALFLNRAFDHYVLDNADLDTELKQAETYAKGYQECVATIPPEVPTDPKEMQAHYQQYIDCALKLDPSLKPMLSPES